MATNKPSNSQAISTLSKPSSKRTVVSPRPRGKRAPAVKMSDTVKQMDKTEAVVGDIKMGRDKDTKDEFDQESVPLTEKEAHMEKPDIFRTDSTLSSGDLDTISIPNVVPNENENDFHLDMESRQEESNIVGDTRNQKEAEQLESGDNKNCNAKEASSKEEPTTHEIMQTEKVEGNGSSDDKGNKNGTSLKGSVVSVNSKEGKSDKIKPNSISVNSKITMDSAVKGSAVSLISKDGRSDIKSENANSKDTKTNSIKGSSVSLKSKETSKESRSSSIKTLNNKSDQKNIDPTVTESKVSIKSNGLVKEGENKNSKTEKTKKDSFKETKVTITDLSCNGVNHTKADDINTNNAVTTDKISLTVPGQVTETPESPSKKPDTRKSSNESDTVRRESTKFSIGSRKSVDLPVQYTTVQMPTTEDKAKPSVYATEDSWIRIAIPYLPVSMAVFCLFLNVVIPGFGTIVSGFSIFCCGKSRVPPKYDQDLLSLLCVNIWVGVAQLFTVSFMLVGWFWSLAWGVKMVILALERRQELKDQRAKELQTLALKAFGSSIPAAHITPMT